MPAQVIPVEQNKQEPLTRERREQRHHTQVPYMPGVQPRYARRTLRKKQRQQHAERGHRTIRGNENGSDVEEDGIHLS